MCRNRRESNSGSYAGRIAPPGMPKTTSTSSSSSERTSDWAPVAGSAVTMPFLGRGDGAGKKKPLVRSTEGRARGGVSRSDRALRDYYDESLHAATVANNTSRCQAEAQNGRLAVGAAPPAPKSASDLRTAVGSARQSGANADDGCPQRTEEDAVGVQEVTTVTAVRTWVEDEQRRHPLPCHTWRDVVLLTRHGAPGRSRKEGWAGAIPRARRRHSDATYAHLWPGSRGWSAGDGSDACGLHEPRILREHPGPVPRRRRGPLLPALRELVVVDEQVERAGGDVEADPVAVAHEGDRPAVGGLGRDVADAQAGRPAGEPAVGEQEDLLAQARALDGAGDGEHLAHPGTAARPLVADDDNVARHERSARDRLHRRLLGVEHARGALEHRLVEAGGLHHGAARRERPAQDRDAAGPVHRRRERTEDFAVECRRRDRGEVLFDCPPGHREGVAVKQAGVEQRAHDDGDAAYPVDVAHHVAAERLDVSEVRRAVAYAVEIIETQVDAGLVRDREQVQHRI